MALSKCLNFVKFSLQHCEGIGPCLENLFHNTVPPLVDIEVHTQRRRYQKRIHKNTSEEILMDQDKAASVLCCLKNHGHLGTGNDHSLRKTNMYICVYIHSLCVCLHLSLSFCLFLFLFLSLSPPCVSSKHTQRYLCGIESPSVYLLLLLAKE